MNIPTLEGTIGRRLLVNFRGGARGFSPRLRSQGLDGLELQIEPFEAGEVFSSFYADESKFPRGSVEYDHTHTHTLLMRKISHRWRSTRVPGAL